MCVHITDHVIRHIVTNIKTLQLSIFAELFEDVLIKILKMLLNFARVDVLRRQVDTGSRVIRTLIHVGEEKGRANRRAIVQTRAPISMTTSPDLEIERTIHSVFFCTEN